MRWGRFVILFSLSLLISQIFITSVAAPDFFCPSRGALYFQAMCSDTAPLSCPLDRNYCNGGSTICDAQYSPGCDCNSNPAYVEPWDWKCTEFEQMGCNAECGSYFCDTNLCNGNVLQTRACACVCESDNDCNDDCTAWTYTDCDVNTAGSDTDGGINYLTAGTCTGGSDGYCGNVIIPNQNCLTTTGSGGSDSCIGDTLYEYYTGTPNCQYTTVNCVTNYSIARANNSNTDICSWTDGSCSTNRCLATANSVDCDNYDVSVESQTYMTESEVTASSCSGSCTGSACCDVQTHYCNATNNGRTFHELITNEDETPDYSCNYDEDELYGVWQVNHAPNVTNASSDSLNSYRKTAGENITFAMNILDTDFNNASSYVCRTNYFDGDCAPGEMICNSTNQKGESYELSGNKSDFFGINMSKNIFLLHLNDNISEFNASDSIGDGLIGLWHFNGAGTYGTIGKNITFLSSAGFTDGFSSDAWTENQMTGSITSGIYRGAITNTFDPYMYRYVTGFDESNSIFVIRYKSYPTGPFQIKIYYVDGTDCPGQSETCTQTFPLNNDGNWHFLIAPMTDAEWIDNDGTISFLRLDFDGQSALGSIYIDEVDFKSLSYPTTSLARIRRAYYGNGDALEYGIIDELSNAPTGEITISVWQKADSVKSQATLQMYPDNTTDRMGIFVPWSDGDVIWDYGELFGEGRLRYTPSPTIIGSWEHFVFVASQSGNYMKIYRNGNEVANKTGMTPFSGRKDAILVGLTSGGTAFNGTIDELSIWNRSLSSSEIKTLYQLGNTTLNNAASNNDVNLMNGAYIWNGKLGTCFGFDGADDYINTSGSASSYALVNGTISAWINTEDAGSSYRGIVVKPQAYGMYLMDNVFGIWDHGGFVWRSTNISLNDGRWHHVAVSYKLGTPSGTAVYIDGVQKMITTASVSNNNYHLLIGSSINIQYFAGFIDEVSVWNRSLSSSEIYEIYLRQGGGYHNLTCEYASRYSDNTSNTGYVFAKDIYGLFNTSLSKSVIFEVNHAPNTTQPAVISTFYTNKSYENITCINNSISDPDNDRTKMIYSWKKNNAPIASLIMPFEDSRNPAKDYSGYNNDGAVIGAIWANDSGYDGYGAYTFDGIDDYINLSNKTELNIRNITITAWVRLNKLKDNQTIISKSSSGTMVNYGLRTGSGLNNDEINFYWENGGTQSYITSNANLLPNNWYHIAVNYDSETVKIYLNGISLSGSCQSGVCNNDLVTNAAHAYIGSSLSANIFNGTIDDLILFNRSLSAEEIMNIYLNRTDTLSYKEVRKGENWSCEVIPNDIFTNGTKKESNSLLVLNTPPYSTGSSMIPQQVFTNDTLTCNGTFFDYDPADSFNLHYLFNGSSGIFQNWSSNNTYDCKNLGCDKGDNITCVFMTDDGIENGTIVISAPITIKNSPPHLTSVNINNTFADFNESISCETSYYDNDTDTITISYKWFINNIFSADETNYTLFLDDSTFFVGDNIRCEASAADGENTTSRNSSNMRLSKVVITSSRISPLIAYANDTLMGFCLGLNRTNIGMNYLNYSINWSVQGVENRSIFDISSHTPGLEVNLDNISGFVKHQNWSFSCQASNGTEFSQWESVNITIQNFPPQISGISINDSNPFTNDTLNCTAQISDPVDNDLITSIIYAWYSNDLLVENQTNETIDLKAPGWDHFDNVSCSINASDDEDSDYEFSAQIMINNSIPIAISVNITEQIAYTNSTITCAGENFDLDSQDSITEYFMFNDSSGILQDWGINNSYDCKNLGCDKFDNITCNYYISDPYSISQNISSAALMIMNTPPNLTVTINNTQPKTNETIRCDAQATDDDNDVITVSYKWYDNSVEVLGQTNETLDLELGGLDRGDIIICEAEAFDGFNTTFINASATIYNSPPQVVNVTINDSAPFTNDLLSCIYYAYDDDNDPLEITYSWYSDTVLRPGLNESELDLSLPDWHRDYVVECEVTANDSINITSTQSAAITIQNTPPLMISANLMPPTAYANDTLIGYCNSTDIDENDIANYYATWYLEGVENATTYSENNMNSLEVQVGNISGILIKYQNWSMTCLADDGANQSASIMIANLTIQNSPPYMSGIIVSPGLAKQNHTINITAISGHDVDNDTSQLSCGFSSGAKDLCNSTWRSDNFYCEYPITLVEEASYDVFCTLSDGLNESIEQTQNFYSDTIPPKLSLITPLNGSIINDSLTVSFNYNISDGTNISFCELHIDSQYNQIVYQPQKDVLINFSVSFEENGVHTWQIICNDSLHNQNISEIRNFNLSVPEFIIIRNSGEQGYNQTSSVFTSKRMVVLEIGLLDTANVCRYQNRYNDENETEWTNWESCTTTKIWSLPEEEGLYYVKVCINHTDNPLPSCYKDYIFLQYSGVNLDTTPPEPFIIHDEGDFTNNLTTLNFTWDEPVDIESRLLKKSFFYSYWLYDNTTGMNMTNYSTTYSRNASFDNLSLEENHTYILLVEAYNSASLKVTSESDGITTDFTPPTSFITNFGSNLNAWTNEKILNFTWDGEDDISGIEGISLIIDAYNDSKPDRMIDSNSKDIFYDNLVEGRYYLKILAMDRAGNFEDNLTQNNTVGEIMIDTTPPTRPVVVNPRQYARSSVLEYSWSQSMDELSGMSNYTLELYEVGGAKTIEWTDNTTHIFSAPTITQTKNYYLVITAKDRAGNSIISSDPNATPVQITYARPDNDANIIDNPIIVVETSKKARCEQNHTNKPFLYTDSNYHETYLKLEDGSYSIKVTCHDESSFSVTEDLEFVVDKESASSLTADIPSQGYEGQILMINLTAGQYQGGINPERFGLVLNGDLNDEFTITDLENGTYSMTLKPKISGDNMDITVSVDDREYQDQIDIIKSSLSVSINGSFTSNPLRSLTYSKDAVSMIGVASSKPQNISSSQLKIITDANNKAYIFMTDDDAPIEKNDDLLTKRIFEKEDNFASMKTKPSIRTQVDYGLFEFFDDKSFAKGQYSLLIRNLGTDGKNKTILSIETK